MTGSNDSEFSPGLLAGRLEGLSLPDLLWALCRREKTGVLAIERRGIRRAIYFDGGRIVFANSSGADDRLGEQFLRDGSISYDQLEEAVASLNSGKRLGTLLVESGALAPEQLVEGVLQQVRSIVLDLFSWEEGEYRFDEGELPTEEVITLEMRTGELLLQGIHRIQSFSRIRRSVGPMRAVYGLSSEGRDALQGHRLTEGEELLVARLEQGDEHVDGLCREVFLSNFEIYQAVWGLKVLGVIEERDRGVERPETASHQGSLADRSFADLLVQLCRGGEEGVLYLSRGPLERSIHIRHGRCVFATSNDPDDGLIAFLLRRGVISLRDREETAKRLLTNKRVGTILREMGVIDDRDLQEMVRQQLTEIVHDTFAWQDGEYAFVTGELPSIEEITLEPTLEALIAGGLRRVTGWSRVNGGAGGMDTRLELTPYYLDILDAMRCGPDEWNVVTALKAARTPREICRESELPDFRVCQILWTLRVLGAAEVARDETVDVDGTAAVASSIEQAIDVALDGTGDLLAAAGPEVEPIDAPDLPIRSEEPEESAEAEAQRAAEFERATRAEEFAETVQAEEWAAEEAEPTAPVEESPSTAATVLDTTQIISADVIAAALAGPPPSEAEAEPPAEPTHEPAETIEAAEPFNAEPEISKSDDEAEIEVISVEGAADESDDVMQTMRMSREQIEDALSGGGTSDWEPPRDVEQTIARFNSIQRVIYRALRAEIGAGAANFVRSCVIRVSEESSDPVNGTEMQDDGTWDVDGLKRVIAERQLHDPWAEYRRLIAAEIDTLRDHISATRAAELTRQIETVEQAQTAHEADSY